MRGEGEGSGIEIRVKNNHFRAPSDQKSHLFFWEKSQKLQFFTLHTDAHDRLDNISTHHKPHVPQITSVLKPSHNMVRSAEERFAVERMAKRGFGAKKTAAALGVPEATTKHWLRRVRSDGDMASRNIGRPRRSKCHVCLSFCWSMDVNTSVEFQPPCSPDLSPFGLFLVERGQCTACSACSQSPQNCGTLLTRVLGTLHRHRRHHRDKQHVV